MLIRQRIDDRHAKPMLHELFDFVLNCIRTTLDNVERYQTHFPGGLALQDTHKRGIGHGRERMMTHARFRQEL